MSTERSDTKPEPRRTIGRPLLVAFVVGLVVGIAGTIIVPGLVRPVPVSYTHLTLPTILLV